MTTNGTANYKPIVDQVQRLFARELGDALPELNDAVKIGKGQASFTITLQVKKAKKGRFVATLAARVRAPREPIELDMHLDEAGQLALGFDESLHGTDEPEGEEIVDGDDLRSEA